jgi:hypothetical protein
LAVALCALTVTGFARADGDPASDVLYTGHVFLPYGTSISGSAQRSLTNTVESSTKAGYPIRVAIVGAPIDLGAVTSLWKQPQQYAKFLSLELSFVYTGPLLIAMPAGLGFAHYKQSTRAEQAALAKVSVVGGRDGLAITAAKAVRVLAARAGHPVSASGSSGSSASSYYVPGVIALAVLGALAVGFLLWRRGLIGKPS